MGEVKRGHGEHNTSYLSAVYDLISDNFILRSLNPIEVYAAPRSISKNPQVSKMLSHAMSALRNFHWILLLNSPNSEEAAGNELLVTKGLGCGLGWATKG